MTKYKATPEEWAADRCDWARADTEALDGDPAFRCIMELRARVEALENDRRAILDSGSRRRIGLDVAEPAVTRDRDETGDYVIVHDAPASSGSLVEWVAKGIGSASPWMHSHRDEARAAIHAAADWLDQQGLYTAATRLRIEVEQ